MRDQLSDALIDAALRQAPEAPVPANFRSRLLAGLPQPAPPTGYDWVQPAVWFAATAAIAPFATLAFRSGGLDLLQSPAMLAWAALVEAVVSLVWVRRILKTAN